MFRFSGQVWSSYTVTFQLVAAHLKDRQPRHLKHSKEINNGPLEKHMWTIFLSWQFYCSSHWCNLSAEQNNVPSLVDWLVDILTGDTVQHKCLLEGDLIHISPCMLWCAKNLASTGPVKAIWSVFMTQSINCLRTGLRTQRYHRQTCLFQ